MISARSRWILLGGTLALGLLLGASGGGGADPAARVLDEDLINEAVDVLEQHYVNADTVDPHDLTVGAIRGLVEALGDDGHTEYLTAQEYQVEEDVLQGRIAGIGVVLDQRSRTPAILSVIDGSPADRAGLRSGDIIASVDGVETARLPDGELADRVRGKPGTRVRLGIERPGAAERLDLSILREEVNVDPVSWAMAPGSNVAVIRVIQFSVGAGFQVRDSVAQAVSQRASGIVLDLRGDPGGLVDEALEAASAFLDAGTAYMERDRNGDTVAVPVQPGRAVDTEIPVVVLVDYGTASSAEILAAALHENGRAELVGEQTFGTGTILNTIRLSDGSALRVGVKEWLTPSGDDVFRVGLTPDLDAALPPGAVRLEPRDLSSLSPMAFQASDDGPLRTAVRLADEGG